jgi:hypothetical protein
MSKVEQAEEISYTEKLGDIWDQMTEVEQEASEAQWSIPTKIP